MAHSPGDLPAGQAGSAAGPRAGGEVPRIAAGREDLARCLEGFGAGFREDGTGSPARGVIADPDEFARVLYAHLDQLRADRGESYPDAERARLTAALEVIRQGVANPAHTAGRALRGEHVSAGDQNTWLTHPDDPGLQALREKLRQLAGQLRQDPDEARDVPGILLKLAAGEQP